MAADLLNQTLGERYRVERRLEKWDNSMAELYQAQDAQQARSVALHRLRPALAPLIPFPAWPARAGREAERVTQPGVLALLDFGQDRERTYLVTNPLPAATLAELVSGWPLEERVAAVQRVADIVAGLHRHQIYLRQVRPATVGVRGSRQADAPYDLILTDVGLIPLAEPDSFRNHLALLERLPDWSEWLAYLPPEYFSNGPIEARSDVYALGMLLHQLATGQLPVTFANVDQALAFHRRQAAPDLAPNIPAHLKATLIRALAPPAERLATVAEFQAELATFLGQPAPPPPTETAPRVAPPVSPAGETAGRVWLFHDGQLEKAVEIPVDRPVSFGRSKKRDQVLDSPSVSSYHIDIRFDGTKYYVNDKGSSNGTFLKKLGLKLAQSDQPLKASEERSWSFDQVVYLGRSGYTLQLQAEAVAARQVAGPAPLQAAQGASGVIVQFVTLSSDSDEDQSPFEFTPGKEKGLTLHLENTLKEPVLLNLSFPEAENQVPWSWRRSTLPAEVSLAAGRVRDITLLLRPTEGPETEPEVYHLVVQAQVLNAQRTQDFGQEKATCTLKVNEFYDFDCWLDSETVVRGLFRPLKTATLHIQNKGNIAQTFELDFDNWGGLKRLKKQSIEVKKGLSKPVKLEPALGLRPTNDISIAITPEKDPRNAKTVTLKTINPHILFWTGVLTLLILLCGGAGVVAYRGIPTFFPEPTTELTSTTPTPETTPAPTPDETQAAAEQAAIQAQQTQAVLKAEIGAIETAQTAPAAEAPEPAATPESTSTPLPPTATLPPAKLGFGQQPPVAVLPGTPIASDITVNILDDNGNTVSGATNSVTLELIPPIDEEGTKILSVRTAEDGVASFSDLIIDAEVQDNYRLKATTTNLDEATSDPFDVVNEAPPSVANYLFFIQEPEDFQVDESINVTVEVRDQFNRRVPTTGIEVNLSVFQGGRETLAFDTDTTKDGVVTFAITVLDLLSLEFQDPRLEANPRLIPFLNFRLIASTPEDLQRATSKPFRMIVPLQLAFSKPPVNTQQPTPIAVEVAVEVEARGPYRYIDEFDNLEGLDVALEIIDPSGTPGPLGITTPTSDGVASFTINTDDLIPGDSYRMKAQGIASDFDSYISLPELQITSEPFEIAPEPTNTPTNTPTPTSTPTNTPTPTPSPTPTNSPPIVNAGEDQELIGSGTDSDTITTLVGTVSDDGLPNPPGTVEIEWKLHETNFSDDFPFEVTIEEPEKLNTIVLLPPHAGIYILRLTASDGVLSTHDDVMITVELEID